MFWFSTWIETSGTRGTRSLLLLCSSVIAIAAIHTPRGSACGEATAAVFSVCIPGDYRTGTPWRVSSLFHPLAAPLSSRMEKLLKNIKKNDVLILRFVVRGRVFSSTDILHPGYPGRAGSCTVPSPDPSPCPQGHQLMGQAGLMSWYLRCPQVPVWLHFQFLGCSARLTLLPHQHLGWPRAVPFLSLLKQVSKKLLADCKRIVRKVSAHRVVQLEVPAMFCHILVKITSKHYSQIWYFLIYPAWEISSLYCFSAEFVLGPVKKAENVWCFFSGSQMYMILSSQAGSISHGGSYASSICALCFNTAFILSFIKVVQSLSA